MKTQPGLKKLIYIYSNKDEIKLINIIQKHDLTTIEYRELYKLLI